MYLLTVEDATGSSAYEMVYKIFKTYPAALKGTAKVLREMAACREEHDAIDALDDLNGRIITEDDLTEIAEEILGDTYFRIHELDVEG